MASAPVLSIVVPVYNAEKHLLECLDSVLAQLTPRVELIVVDDGSTDSSAMLVKERIGLLVESGQVRFEQQCNAGPGAARNLGISMAKGQYIGFLDSDDLLAPNYVKEILRITGDYEVDIIEFPFRRFADGQDIVSTSFDGTYGAVGRHELDPLLERIFATARWFPCTRVFSRSLFDSLQFPVHVHYEDLMTIPFVYLRASTIYFVEQPLYAYRLNPESITSRHTQRQMDEVYQFFRQTDSSKSEMLAILKIRTGRTLVYFGSELSSRLSELIAIAVEATRVAVLPCHVELLLPGDRLFYRWPRLYVLIEIWRLPLKQFRGNLLSWLRIRPNE